MSGGYILLHRSVFDGFGTDPFTEREAWIWCLCEANFQPHTINQNGSKILIKRGEFPTSIRKLATQFQWSNNRVSRFLDRYSNEYRLGKRTDTGFLIISICNYDKYQNSLTIARTLSDTGSDTQADTYINKGKKERKKEGGESPAKIPCRFSEEKLPPDWRNWVEVNHPMLKAQFQFDQFRDRKLSETGAKAISSDWFAEFRIWCRRSEVWQKPEPPPKARYTPMPSAAGG